MIRIAFNDGWKFKRGMDGVFESPGGYREVTLPHDAMILEHREEKTPNANGTGFYPGGTYTYVKKFRVEEADREKEILILFEGVYERATVYLNGSYAEKRPYGYSHFHVRTDGLLHYGAENVIKVVARTGAMPNSRWYSGSGIYRPVHLLKADRLHVAPDGFRMTTEFVDAEMAVMEAAVTLENHRDDAHGVRLETVLLDPQGQVVASDMTTLHVFRNDNLTIRQRMTIQAPQCWSPDSPLLYTAKCSVTQQGRKLDETVAVFGIRTLQLDTVHGLRINGQTVKLRGACIHHDNGVIGACTFARAEERRAEKLKSAGFNAIRSAHNPLSQAMLDACDRVGLLVMDETFDMWQVGKVENDYSLHFDEWWERDVEAMVAKDYNHPCVVLYSIGNEIIEAGNAQGASLNRKMAEKIRSLDATRYVTNCVNGFLVAFPHMKDIMEELVKDGVLPPAEPGTPAGEVNQFMMNIAGLQPQIAGTKKVREILEETYAGVDVAGYNYMISLYEKDCAYFPNRVILGSETCAPDIGIIWPIVMANTHVIGDFTWTGWEYLGEAGVGIFSYVEARGFFKPYPSLMPFVGDIDITGHRRPMSYYREVVYGLRQNPYIAVQRVNRYGQKVYKTQWNGNDTVSSWTWPGYEASPAIVEVYANAEEVALLLNGVSLDRKRVGKDMPFAALFQTVYQPGVLEAVSYSAGRETGRMQLQTAGPELLLSVEADRTQLVADGQDVSFLMVTVTDSQKVPNLFAELPVTVTVGGAGILQGFGSADPKSTEHFFDTTRTTFDGRVLAVVRTTGESGEIHVAFSSPGCTTRQLVLRSER